MNRGNYQQSNNRNFNQNQQNNYGNNARNYPATPGQSRGGGGGYSQQNSQQNYGRSKRDCPICTALGKPIWVCSNHLYVNCQHRGETICWTCAARKDPHDHDYKTCKGFLNSTPGQVWVARKEKANLEKKKRQQQATSSAQAGPEASSNENSA